MLKLYCQSLLARLRSNEDGVVSFEYILVAACIIAAVGAAFGTGGSGAIYDALSGGITTIAGAFSTALGT